ncbi:MAG: tRNA (adenosine(37)-N6)-dimethylallyltransferase MiaA [Aestuariivirgaceae bacterium]|nr:tRNA (adenosine(37)-N6)-dimethylallyltransferase MiaA [Aestuariivirgaceae bacterium]
MLIAGPTASGKSALALALAREFNGVIVNADAMQVYEPLRVLTARPSVEDEAQAPHRLYGHVAAYSVGRYLKDAAVELASDKMPIFVGGTGLYFRSMEKGIAEIPEPDPQVRAYYRNKRAWALHEELERRAPEEAARLLPTDSQRLARALEVLESSGHTLGHYYEQAQGEALLNGRRVTRIYLEPERELLYSRINARFSQMLKAGALEEVVGLMNRGLDAELPVMKAIGVPELAAYAAGSTSIEEAERLSTQNTRHYAKRQMTWARSNMIAWEFRIEQFSEKERAEIFAFIRGGG